MILKLDFMSEKDKSKLFLLKSKLRATLPIPIIAREQDANKISALPNNSAGILRSRIEIPSKGKLPPTASYKSTKVPMEARVGEEILYP